MLFMNGRVSNIRSVHMYVIPRTVFFIQFVSRFKIRYFWVRSSTNHLKVRSNWLQAISIATDRELSGISMKHILSKMPVDFLICLKSFQHSHRDAYVLGQGFWLFPRYQAHLEKNFLAWNVVYLLSYNNKKEFLICV